jgi:GxxExxY protein
MPANNANATGGNIIFPELSYEIIGSAFSVANQLGWGLKEKEYQRALALELENRGLNFKEQVLIPIVYKNTRIENCYADFIVENKILLELKVVHKLGYSQAKQVLGYLKTTGIKLGILIYFTKEGVKYRRILNASV